MGDFFPVLRRLNASKGAFLAVLGVVTLVWSGDAAAQSAAQRAVDAAKKICAGKTVTIVWEAGLQSLDPLNFSGPKWEELTGCKVKVVEVPTAEMFTKIMQECCSVFRRSCRSTSRPGSGSGSRTSTPGLMMA